METYSKTRGQTVLQLEVGDITRQDTLAIVNAANSTLLGGGGVDGAIHRGGGPQILKECQAIVQRIGKCEPGRAVITSGGKLSAKYVVHTVGPFWRGGNNGEPEVLRRCYINSLNLARENGIKTIAFPSISTGTYRYPVEAAAEVALTAVWETLLGGDFETVKFILFNESIFNHYQSQLERL